MQKTNDLWDYSTRHLLELLKNSDSCESEEFKLAYVILQLRKWEAVLDKLASIAESVVLQADLLYQVAVY